jgi:hypothetical protein
MATAATFALWQGVLLTQLGPSTFAENLAALREVTAGAAAVFSPELMLRSLRELVSLRAYLFLLLPVLVWAAVRLLRPGNSIVASLRAEQRLQLSVLLLMVGANLGWMLVASVGWVRYAFPGLALAAIFVALAGANLTDGYHPSTLANARVALPRRLAHMAALLLLAAMIVAPAARLALRIATAPPDPAQAMAAALTRVAPADALVESWEPHLGFLTNHTYHYPPQLLLNRAVRQVWQGETPVADLYDFRTLDPDFVLVGEFGRWVNVYPPERLDGWPVVAQEGPYTLYRRPGVEGEPAPPQNDGP